MKLNDEAAKLYTTILPDDDRAHIFPGIAGRRKVNEISVKEIQGLHAKGWCKDLFIPIATPAAPAVSAPLPLASDQINAINAATSAEEVDTIVGTDARKTVLDAATAKKGTFSK